MAQNEQYANSIHRMLVKELNGVHEVEISNDGEDNLAPERAVLDDKGEKLERMIGHLELKLEKTKNDASDISSRLKSAKDELDRFRAKVDRE